jgi:hypothetical protein
MKRRSGSDRRVADRRQDSGKDIATFVPKPEPHQAKTARTETTTIFNKEKEEEVAAEVEQLLLKHPEIRQQIRESHKRIMAGDETGDVGIEEMEKIFEENRPKGRTKKNKPA